MSNPTGDDAQSVQDEEEREGEQLCLKIKAQLEDLFSDSHLAEDGFLLKHLQKNKQGYVSLKLLTSLKKIKTLTSNWSVTLAAAGDSDLLEVNDDSTKVRRRRPLPKWLLCSPTNRLLLAWNFPADESRDDADLSGQIIQRFSEYGSITSVWILRPGKELPKELLPYTKRHKTLGLHLSAAVKFDHLEAVRKAWSALKNEEVERSEGGGVCVLPLGPSFQRIGECEPLEEDNEDTPGKSQEDPVETSVGSAQEDPCSSATVLEENSDASQAPEANSTCYSQPLSASGHGRMSWSSGDFDRDVPQSPWVLRRKLAVSTLNPNASGRPSMLGWTQRVLRQPLGPDEEKGFHRRGRKAPSGP